ncbi:MAG: hypothetical protein GC129_07010 [Proteobacteria bacterium]|nr:hypothetical protein [Pseudomonadota bacterium]
MPKKPKRAPRARTYQGYTLPVEEKLEGFARAAIDLALKNTSKGRRKPISPQFTSWYHVEVDKPKDDLLVVRYGNFTRMAHIGEPVMYVLLHKQKAHVFSLSGAGLPDHQPRKELLEMT